MYLNFFGYYTGQSNDAGEAHGEGIFTSLTGELYRGTFKEDVMDGYSKKLCL